uniref:pyridoxal 5'-phosphate synthase n=1 Tax=Timema cristinae TaxID=61476 RepID=A0A7R9GQK5_TIMCR|nr:unnamed protein product [Timema cristinae]
MTLICKRQFVIVWRCFKNMANLPVCHNVKSVNIEDMRHKYKDSNETFTEDNLKCKEPIGQFKEWFEEACKVPEMEANAVHLATATKIGAPSVRPVLLKGYGTDGFKFYTNYGSRKGQELAENPRAALSFYWEPLKRCVRVEGRVEKLTEQESDSYFHSRPLDSQIGSSVSAQSTPIPSRETLTQRELQLAAEYGDGKKELPRPSHWGGYVVIPESVEFWQGQTTRIHDRIHFRRPRSGEQPDGVMLHQGENGWVYERLSP